MPELSLKQKNENISTPAQAEIRTQISYVGGIAYSETAWLKLNVGNNQAWTTNN